MRELCKTPNVSRSLTGLSSIASVHRSDDRQHRGGGVFHVSGRPFYGWHQSRERRVQGPPAGRQAPAIHIFPSSCPKAFLPLARTITEKLLFERSSHGVWGRTTRERSYPPAPHGGEAPLSRQLECGPPRPDCAWPGSDSR